MRIDELVLSLYDVRETVMSPHSTEELYRSSFGDSTSVQDVMNNLVNAHFETKEKIDAIFNGWNDRPRRRRSLSDVERLLLICRAEGSIAVLTQLLQAQSASHDVRLVIDSRKNCEIPWAMRDLWEPFYRDHLASAAQNFSQGKWSVLD